MQNSRGVYLFRFLSFPLMPSFLASYKLETTNTVDRSTQTLVMNVSVKSNLTSKQKRKKPNVTITLRKSSMHCTFIFHIEVHTATLSMMAH